MSIITVNDGHAGRIAKIQKDSNIEILQWNHPFVRLRAFNIYTAPSKASHIFLAAKVRNTPTCTEQADIGILEALYPIWDFANTHLRDKFFISINIERNLSEFTWTITATINIEAQADMEMFVVMLRLGGAPDMQELNFV